jgi:hypothetical protein
VQSWLLVPGSVLISQWALSFKVQLLLTQKAQYRRNQHTPSDMMPLLLLPREQP